MQRATHGSYRWLGLSVLLALAFASVSGTTAQAQGLTINNLKLDYGAYKITVPSLEVIGSALGEADFRRILDAADAEPALSRLGRLTAESITAREMTIEQVLMGQTSTTRYENIVFSGIKAGFFASLSAAVGTSTLVDPTLGKTLVTMNGTRVEGLDLPALARALNGTRAPGETAPFLTIYKNYSVESTTQNLGPAVTVNFGRVSGSGFQLRPGTTPAMGRITSLFELAAASQAAQANGGKAAGEKIKEPDGATLAGYLALWEDLRMGMVEARDINVTISATDPTGKPAMPAKAGDLPKGNASFRIARMAFADTGEAATSGFWLEGLSGKASEAPKGSAKAVETEFGLGKLAVSGFSSAPSLAALREALLSDAIPARADDGKGKAAPVNPPELDFMRMIPKLGTIQLSDLSFVSPQIAQRASGPSAAPVNVALRNAEFTVRAQENGIPSDLRMALEDLAAPIPANEASSKPLTDLGYKNVTMSSRIDLGWNRERNEITVRDASLDGLDMLKFALSGTIGNATRELFSGDTALAQVAALGATVRSLDMRLQNLGLFDRLLTQEARKAKTDTDSLRREWGSIAAIALPSILGDSEAARTITAAVARFVARPRTLIVSAKARGANGVGLADMIAVSDPKALLDKIDVKASAE
jgi:hypothetical protein